MPCERCGSTLDLNEVNPVPTKVYTLCPKCIWDLDRLTNNWLEMVRKGTELKICHKMSAVFTGSGGGARPNPVPPMD